MVFLSGFTVCEVTMHYTATFLYLINAYGIGDQSVFSALPIELRTTLRIARLNSNQQPLD